VLGLDFRDFLDRRTFCRRVALRQRVGARLVEKPKRPTQTAGGSAAIVIGGAATWKITVSG